jgi:hypothetical protein
LATAATAHSTRMSLEQLSEKSPIEVAEQFFLDKTGNAMTDLQREMFNEAYRQATINS